MRAGTRCRPCCDRASTSPLSSPTGSRRRCGKRPSRPPAAASAARSFWIGASWDERSREDRRALMYGAVQQELQQTLTEIRKAGLYKNERQLASPQSAHVRSGGSEVLNFCANNYLGLADHPSVVAAAQSALDTWGFGMASVRFICGTQTQHVELEARLASFLGQEATILYSSCFDANGGLFEVLLDENDAVISDELNHASIIDGIRLCKAKRFRYKNRDMASLTEQLE